MSDPAPHHPFDDSEEAMQERDDNFARVNEDPESPLGPMGCLFPGECCMPGEHYESECHTPEHLM